MQIDSNRGQPPHRLTRSYHDRLWAGVAGGLAEYFDVDPVLVRLAWVAATILTGGLGLLAYIVLWIVMPPAEPVPPVADGYRDPWLHDVQASTQAFADEVRRVASEVRGRPTPPPPGPESGEVPPGAAATESTPPEAEWGGAYQGWERHRRRRHLRQESAGFFLVVLGLIFLASNAGLFRWIRGDIVWPLVIVALGLALLLNQGGSRRW